MPIWTQEMKDRRRNNAITRLMEDLQVTLDEATGLYDDSFRKKASKGGKKGGGKGGFKNKELAKRASYLAAEARRKK